MWQEMVTNEIWVNNNFLNLSDLSALLDHCSKSISYRMCPGEKIRDTFDQLDINPTLYDYSVVHANIREQPRLIRLYQDALNDLFNCVSDLSFNTANPDMLQLFVKSFTPGSFYELHAEPVARYGPFAFIHFLEDCPGGELIFPSLQTLESIVSSEPAHKKSFDLTQSVFNRHNESLRCIGDCEIQPKKNCCVIFRVGSLHWVRRVPADAGLRYRRLSVSGWPFISQKLIRDLSENCGLSDRFNESQ
jgi:hypothetical protein